ncbi:WEB family protein At1g12150-like [Neltuma alba]|uniref:WEB family protein At1g12150-like n=1 Tax=Neltuma alba TaxID=207710 RepID=UPI0010A4E3FC|nr:WEB family protein At1g12150-like [Prosopis alba]XP_028769829.1 WEB family protein At1g12150-like [Prosopis alba]XP_028769834.1 WEB family protein At1g12150-like [Prosopis alba]
MVNFRKMDSQKDMSSPRGEVGEIDTRAPFQSVKAAVSLFGEVAVSKEKRSVRRRSSENVLEKETQLLLAQRELNKIKKQLESAETTKSKALAELEKAKVTLQDLTTKLTNVRESKEAAMEAAEAVKNQAKQLERAKSQKEVGFEAWKLELEHARKEYTTTVKELDAAKQELTKIRQDFDAALEAKLAAFQTAGEAQRSAKLNSERISELSNEIAAMKTSVEELKLASLQTQEEQAKAMAEREAQYDSYKNGKEEAEAKMESLMKEYDPELNTEDLEAKLAETSAEIEVLQEQMKKEHASDMEAAKAITSELKEATKTLGEVAEEESSLRNLVALLKDELENVKTEQRILKDKEQKSEALASYIKDELQKSKGETNIEELEKASKLFHEQSMKIEKLTEETETAKRDAEEMNQRTHDLKQEAEKARALAQELETKLEIVLKEAEEVKAAEQRALEEMKILSEMQGNNKNQVSDVTNSEDHGKIKLSVDKFESVTGKVKECADLVEKAELAAITQVVAIKARQSEADKKLEANLKAIEEIKAATEMALKNAEMADSAKMALEGELRRLRQQDKVPAESAPLDSY